MSGGADGIQHGGWAFRVGFAGRSEPRPYKGRNAMALAELNGLRMRYEIDGPASAPVLVFSHPLGTDLTMWDGQAADFSKKFRVLRYDKRGHGGSSSPAGSYTIEHMGRDAVALLDYLKLGKVNYCGLSIGGQTGMWLGVNAPERINKLVLSNTAAKIGNADGWKTRIEAVRKDGVRSVSQVVLDRWFTAEFQSAAPKEIEKIRLVFERSNAEGYVASCAAVRDFDFREKVGRVRVPTLVIAGTHDPATTPVDTKFVADRIGGARFVELNASHLSNIEAREKYSAAVAEFLA
jgi:3-oxoadipate enol-lactonase